MKKAYRFPLKVLEWGGNRQDIESVLVHAKQLTENERALEMVSYLFYVLAHTDYLHPIAFEMWAKKQSLQVTMKKHRKTKGAVYQVLHRQRERLNTIILAEDNLMAIMKDADNQQDKINYYHMIFSQLVERYRMEHSRSITHLFTFDIENYAEVDHKFNYDIGEADFENLTQALQMTVQPFLEEMLNQMDKRMIGYILYLMRGDKFNLTERDLARKEYLKAAWLLEM